MAAPLRNIVSKPFQFSRTIFLRYLSSESVKNSSSSQTDSPKQTHFGFESVDEGEKQKKVDDVFESVASSYDLMNDAMSAGVHRLWKDYFMAQLSPSPGTKLLDVAGGTGDIAFRFLRYVQNEKSSTLSSDIDFEMPREVTAQVFMDPSEISPSSSSSSESSSESESDNDTSSRPNATKHTLETDATGSHVTVCDINQAMLDVGIKRADALGINQGMNWVKGNAEKLPLPDNTYDAYTIAFGIRNCTHVQEVLNEAYRVLKPGGRFMCLEFSEVKNPVLSSIYDKYSFEVIPVMGKVLAGDWKSYQYLVESIRQFPNQEAFADMIKAAGFRLVSHKNLTFGIAAIHTGFKI